MSKKGIDLSNIPEEELLSLRVCDLPLTIKGTWLEGCIAELYRELEVKGMLLKPPCYLADEWLTPDDEAVIGIPFFLAHPVLMKLEKRMMLDVEGGTRSWCLKLLRHEAGHAVNYAYRLYKRKKWQKIFGKFDSEYADTYRFRPYSRSFVRHLEDYYAQYHPDEDFAETFAVWLTPHLDWQSQYKGWKAFNKLKYVDSLMKEIKHKSPLRKGKKYWQASRLRITLKNYYKRKRSSAAEYFPDFHDANLMRIFSKSLPATRSEQKENTDFACAHDVIKKYRRNILESVSRWTGEKKYIINDLLETLITRSKKLKLVTAEPEGLVIVKISTYVATLIMNFMYTGRFRGKK